jgi:hypothetical protein
MKKTISICLLTLFFATFPAVGGDPSACLAQFKAETDALAEQYKELDKHSDELGKRRSKADTKAEQDALIEEGKAIAEKRKAVKEQGDEAAKRMNRCMGMPTSKEEVNKLEADMKAKIAADTIKFESQLKALDAKMNAAKAKTGASTKSGDSNIASTATQGLVAMPSIPDGGSAPPTMASSSLPSFGSGRTREQRAAALSMVNAELNRMPYTLPQKENAPSKSDILKLAASRNASARKSFGPDDLWAYSKVVIWAPRFDGSSPDAKKAKELSLPVSSVTNYFNKPQLMIALAAAVFSLDPQSTPAANNFASAIVTAGERLFPNKTQVKELASYRTDAESCFLYAMANSMKGDAWTDESLTSILNLGNLYIDMSKLEEARSLFQLARKQSPFSWDAALGMAAYFHAVNKPDKAVAILEDDNLDKPQTLMIAKKHEKALEKNDEVPIDSPEQVYEDRIDSVNAEPIATAADFMSQIDQSERNKMRYFVENLPVKGSFTAPPINKLTQYASLKAISAPRGISALKDFMQMLQIYSMSSFAAASDEQLKMLSRLGLNVNPGIDLNDVAKNPQKYANSKTRPKAKMDKQELMANLENLKKQATAGKLDLATGKTASSLAMAAQFDPLFGIAQLDPQNYADPMNIIIQKHNFAVLNRKTNLYNGYLYKVNNQTRQAFNEIVANYQRKITEAEKVKAAALEVLEKRQAEAEASGTSTNMKAEWALRKHNVHVQYFNTCNAAAESAFGSATNSASVAYVQKIKPKAEAYYYDVIRQVGLISDPEVRDRKDAELHRAIYSALVSALNTVGAAHGSFKYHPEWECGCDVGNLLREREQEQAAQKDEENARIMRNKAAKLVFDSGEIPESSPLWKKLDSFGSKVDLGFISWKITCARTVVNFSFTVPLVPGSPKIFASQEVSEFTGAGKYDQGIKVSLKAGEGVGAYISLSSSVTTSGEGVVKDYSVTAATGLSVSGKGTTAMVGGQMTFGPNGVRDSDFSAGISKDFSNEMGGEGNVSFEASTKRGCSLSGNASQTLEGAKKFIDDAKTKAIGKDAAKLIFTDDFLQKELWSGKYGGTDKSK